MKTLMMPQSRGPASGVLLVTFISATIALTALAGVPTCAPAPPGLVGWWAGEGNASDSAGTNNGALYGGMSFAPGEAGQAFAFDGSSGYVEMPASASLNVGAGAGFTFECWIKPAALADAQPVVEWNSGADAGLHLWISQPPPYGAGSGSIYVNLIDTTGAFHTLSTGAGILNTNGFQHVALSYDKASGMASLYYNGALVALGMLGSFSPQTSVPLYLGKRISDAPFVAFQGLMDEASLYSRALTAAEIQAIYNAGSAGKCPVGVASPTNGLALYYPFNGNANDASGNGNNGTVQGATLTADRFGIANSAYSFNGTSSEILVPETVFGATNAAWTLSVWITTDGGPYSGDQQIYTKSCANGQAGIGILDGQIEVGIKTASQAFYIAAAPLLTNSTMHVVGVYQKGQSLSLYINGLMVTNTPVSNEDLFVSSFPLISSLGSYHYTGGPYEWFRGTIDDFSVYTRALSASEVQQLYASESAPPPPSVPTNGLDRLLSVYRQRQRCERERERRDGEWRHVDSGPVWFT